MGSRAVRGDWGVAGDKGMGNFSLPVPLSYYSYVPYVPYVPYIAILTCSAASISVFFCWQTFFGCGLAKHKSDIIFKVMSCRLFRNLCGRRVVNRVRWGTKQP